MRRRPGAIWCAVAALVALGPLPGCSGPKPEEPTAKHMREAAKAQSKESCDFRASRAERLDEPVSAFLGCPLYLPSPDGKLELRSRDLANHQTELFVVNRDGSSPRRVGQYETPTGLLWSPGSNAIMINDQKGSGQTSYLEVAHVEPERVVRSLSAQRNLSAMFKTMFRCDFDDEYVVTSGDSWLDRSTLLVTVQANHHSGGCPLDPYSANQLTLLVDADSGTVIAKKLPQR
jgi:hypothetical protein